MKSRTSFFDKTVLKKDLIRFWPLWALYLVGGLLIMHMLFGFYDNYYQDRGYAIARDLNTIIGPMSIFSALYGFLAAQLLFGDLHSTRLCYGVHAMPLRREGWYLTHTASGLLMGLVPPMVILLTLVPLMGKFWYTALLCWGGLALHYLFFFALSVLCMMVTGKRFAAVAVYGILNFLSLIIQWVAGMIFVPMLPGVRSNSTAFNLFSPVVSATGRDSFFRVAHLESCPCHQLAHFGYVENIWRENFQHEYGFMGLGSDWGYLLIVAGVGLALLAGGLLLYRIRHLERAGDFMAFESMKPIFLGVYTLCVGSVMFYLAHELSGTATGYVFLIIGLFIGYFTGKMLLERTIRVFKGRSWAGLGILYGAMALSLLLTWADPLGIARRIPETSRVETVVICDGRLSDYQLDSDRIDYYDNVASVSDPADIATIRDIHRQLLQEHDSVGGNGYCPVTLQYRLKNGGRVSRTYYVPYNGEVYRRFTSILCQPEHLFGVTDAAQLYQQATYIRHSTLGEIPKELWPELLAALWKDTQAGHISLQWRDAGTHIEIHTQTRYREIFFSSEAVNLIAWTNRHERSPQLLLKCGSPEQLQADLINLSCPDLGLSLQSAPQLMKLLWQDCLNGKVNPSSKNQTGILLELQLKGGFCSLRLDMDSESFQWLKVYRLLH